MNTETNRPFEGMLVSYEDMANPRRDGVIFEIRHDDWGTQYGIRFEDGEEVWEVWTTLGQHGWTRA